MFFNACVVIFALYGLFILIAIIGWLIPNRVPDGWQINKSPTLIIPFRNEEKNLTALINSIEKQSIKPRVIFVDDSSTDASISQISLLENQVILNEGTGKKAANATGIRYANTPLIIFTDADCTLKENHIKSISENFAYTNFDFAYGPVLNSTKKPSLWNSIFFLDQLSLNAVALGTGKLNMHLFCSGANMAGKKKILNNAHKELIESNNLSGDDLTLLNHCRLHNSKIVSLTDKRFIVTTNAPSTLGEFLKQRLRWGQKTGIESNFPLILLSLCVFLSSALAIFSLIASLSEFWIAPWYLLPLGKLLIDLLFLFLVSCRLRVLHQFWFFIPAWIFNTLYVPVIAIIGLVYSGTWKGRKIRSAYFGEVRQ